MFEFCICDGTDTEFCPFHDPKNIERKKMAEDKLTKMYDEWVKSQLVEPTKFQAFQAGLTAGAVAMRSRAIKIAQDGKATNDVVNKLGQLSDIPE